MRTYVPEGFILRNPMSRKRHRTALVSLRRNDEWSSDGHDKLNKIGFPIYAYRDKASGKLVKIWVVPNNRSGRVIAYLWLDLVGADGRSVHSFLESLSASIVKRANYASMTSTGIPIQATADCGSETTMQFAMAVLLR